MTDTVDAMLAERFAAQLDPLAAPDFADVRRRSDALRAPAATRRRRRTLIAIGLAALVVAGTATAVSRQFFGTTSNTLVPIPSGATVPGLAGMGVLLPVSSAPSPTAARCAEAWNTEAPRETLRWLETTKPVAVGVGVGVMKGAELRLGTFCHLRFLLDAGRMALVQGPWLGDGVPRWRGAVLAAPGLPASMWNGAVHADGTVECRVRCDAVATLPSSSGASTRRAGVPDGCSLVSPAEVAAALGRRLQNGRRDGDSCIWHDGPLNSPADITLRIGATRLPKATFLRLLTSESGARRLDGLGEAAFYFRDGDLLTVWADGFALTISNRTTNPLESSKRLAAAALARLGRG